MTYDLKLKIIYFKQKRFFIKNVIIETDRNVKVKSWFCSKNFKSTNKLIEILYSKDVLIKDENKVSYFNIEV